MKYFIYLLIPTFLLAFDLQDLTVEEKVGQLLMTYVNGDQVNQESKRLIKKTNLGGVILYRYVNKLENPKQIKNLCNNLQQLSEIPLFIATDQEGGRVAHLKKGFTQSLGNGFLGKSHDKQLTYSTYHQMGKEMHEVGINMNFAPVVDVNSNPENPIIGDRSFSSQPKQVVSLGKQAVSALLDSSTIPCLKHFPGHGDTKIDSHLVLPVVDKSLKELKKIELYPFQKLAAISPVIMTAHILFPQIDEKNPATLSSFFLQKLLREQWGFEGVIITDSLTMKGILQNHPIEEAAIKAFEAGCDILLIGGEVLDPKSTETHVEEIISIYHALLDAVYSGRISEKRVDQSVERILKLKEIL